MIREPSIHVGAHPTSPSGHSIRAFDNPTGDGQDQRHGHVRSVFVRTPGVFVTVMLRWSAAATSM